MISIYIPCQVFEVPVTAGPSERLSRVERLVLEAIHAGVSAPGVTYFRDLVELFQLGHRPTLDLIVDLWHRGYAAVDVEQRLWITEPVRQRIDRLEELSSGQVKQVRLPIMQELLSGHILDYRRGPTVFQPIQVAPPVLELGSLRRASIQEVMQVLERQLEQRFSREDEPWKVLEVNLGFAEIPSMAPEVRHALLEARVECSYDGAAERQVFRIVDPPSLNARARVDIEAVLANLAETRADHPFFKKIKEEAEAGQKQVFVYPGELIARLRQEVERLGRVNPSNLAHYHDELVGRADDVNRWIEDNRGRRVEVRCLETLEDHETALEEIIYRTNHQLILASPRPRYKAFDELRPAIKEAMDRGVHVYVLWGSLRDDRLETALGNLLSDLKGDHPLRMLYSERSARIQTSFLLADDHHLLLSSWSFLEHGCRGAKSAAFHDFGFLLTRPASAIDDLLFQESLDWVAQNHPEQRIARRIKSIFDEKDGSGGDVLFESGVKLPSFRLDEDESYGRSHVHLWRNQWQAVAARFDEALDDPSITGQWVSDGQHREVFWSALRHPGRCLMIVSWKLDPDVVKPIMVEAFESWLQGGARILIGFRDEVGPCPARLKKLGIQFPESFKLIRISGNFPQLLLTDEVCLLSSYGFLSFAGYYDAQRAHEMQRHLGVLLRGRDLVRQTLDALERWFPEAAWLAEALVSAPGSLIERAAPSPGAAPQTNAIPAGLQELVSDLAHQPEDVREENELVVRRAQLLRRWFHDVDAATAWRALDVLAEIGLPDFERAVASCLAVRPPEEDGLSRQRWVGWLVDHLWYHGEVWQRPDNALRVAVLSQSIEPATVSAERPPYWLAVLTAARPHAAILRERLMEAVLRTSLTDAEIHSLGAIGISAILERAEAADVACEGMDLLENRLPGILGRCASSVRSFWRQTGSTFAPTAVHAWMNKKRQLARIDEVRNRFLDQIERERRRNFEFSLVRHAWSVLFGEEGLLHDLIAAVQASDSAKARRWLDQERQDPNTILDEATEEGMQKAGFSLDRRERDRRIIGGNRTACLREIKEFLDAAETWATLHGGQEAALDANYQAAVLQLSREIKALLPELETFMKSRSGLEAPLLRGMIGNLHSLAEIDS